MLMLGASDTTIATLPAGEEFARFRGTKTFGSLDGLRALAILAVLWHHAAGTFGGLQITGRGFLGVDLFFAISGFLIVTLLLRERDRTGTIALRDYYIRRFLRILPAYYLMIGVVAAIAFIKPGNTTEAIKRDIPFAVFFLSDLVPMRSLLAITWSLSVEEQFYLIMPAIEKYARGTVLFLLPIAYVAVSLPALGAFPSVVLPEFFRQTTFGPILLGVMLAHTLHHAKGFRLVYRAVGGFAAPILVLILVVATASWPVEDISGWPRICIQWVLLALVASCVVRENNGIAPLLSLWPMRRIGVVSYGIYLFHLIVMHSVTEKLHAAGIKSLFGDFAGTALATWLVAELDYRFFEVRFLKLKARFQREKAVSGKTLAV